MKDIQRWEDERWPEVRQEEDDWEVAASDEDRRFALVPIVNPYAVIALVAALLLLVPVALVFGVIAFSYPRGRVMALFALLLGAMEVVAVVVLFLLPGNSLSSALSRNENRAQLTSSAVTSTAAAPPVTPAPKTPEPAVTPTTAAETTSNPGTPTAVQGTACPEAGRIGTTESASTLLCLSASASSTGYQWQGPYTVAPTVAEGGSSCQSATSQTARTADGRALVCEGQGNSKRWVLWTE